MKKGMWLFCGLAVVLMLAWTYVGAQEGAAPKGDRPAGGRTMGGGMFGSIDARAIATEMGLTDKQAEQLAGLIANQQILGMYTRLKLEDAQKDKVKAACMAACKDLLGAERSTAFRGIMENVRNNVLTDEQKKMGMGGRTGGERKGGERKGGERKAE